MEEIIKSYAAIIVACIAAAISIINLVWSARINEGTARRKTLWERELIRFSELEDTAGKLVEDLLSYKIRTDEDRAEARDKLKYLHVATGSFLRYTEIAKALRLLSSDSGWYISRDMQHETKEEFEEARTNLITSYESLIKAIDKTLKDAPKRL
ncbi:MAG: hypothetical protein GY820_24055 [Gammaproteobacteria bacterium]|nr:hypothetical protein [Gammaproteobacteria bacterium]